MPNSSTAEHSVTEAVRPQTGGVDVETRVESTSKNEEEAPEVDTEVGTNLETDIPMPQVPTSRIHNNHPTENIIGDPSAGIQTRHITIAENNGMYAEILDTGIMETCLYSCFISQVEPKDYKVALKDNSWVEAMQDELSQFTRLQVWELVDPPERAKVIGTKWVFKCKYDDRGVVVRNKARLVVLGFLQQEGLD